MPERFDCHLICGRLPVPAATLLLAQQTLPILQVLPLTSIAMAGLCSTSSGSAAGVRFSCSTNFLSASSSPSTCPQRFLSKSPHMLLQSILQGFEVRSATQLEARDQAGAEVQCDAT